MPAAPFFTVILLAATLLGLGSFPTDDPPTEWIDAATGHRVIRLSREAGSASLYFHQNAYSADGRKLIFTTPSGISAINLKTHEIDKVVEGRVSVIVAGRRSSQVYYMKGNTLCATSLDNGVTREITTLPARWSVSTLNADETILAGSYVEASPLQPSPAAATQRQPQPQATGPDGKPLTFAEQREVSLNDRLEQHIPMAMFTVDVGSGETKTFYRSTDWLNHLQFSPADPTLLMFCHEGPWHKVDRIWTVRTDGTHLMKIHTRSMNMEIAGHEFWSPDGKIIWYDLQTPRGEDFWVAGFELASGARTFYHLQRDEWSVHFNVSPDGKMFAGDGGDEEMVAHARDGKWIYLFRPAEIPDVAGIKAPNAKELVRPGFLKSERLVSMARHDYRLEPNVTFTPDGKWVVFRSNMYGPTHVFAVEVEKAK